METCALHWILAPSPPPHPLLLLLINLHALHVTLNPASQPTHTAPAQMHAGQRHPKLSKVTLLSQHNMKFTSRWAEPGELSSTHFSEARNGKSILSIHTDSMGQGPSSSSRTSTCITHKKRPERPTGGFIRNTLTQIHICHLASSLTAEALPSACWLSWSMS